MGKQRLEDDSLENFLTLQGERGQGVYLDIKAV
jgi:hypothetical protein